MAVSADTPIELVQGVYGHLAERVDAARQRFGRPHEPELEDATLGRHPRCRQLALDGPQPPERLAQRVGGHEPPVALAGIEQPGPSRRLERSADGDPADAVLGRKGGLAG